MSDLKRRDFLRAAGAGLAGGAVGAGCSKGEPDASAGGAPAVSGRKFEWKMVTSWPPGFRVLGEAAESLAKWADVMSGGRLKIKVYGAGEQVPALKVFEAVRKGSRVQLGHTASYYWRGKLSPAQFFASVPFGMNAQGMNAWLTSGGALKLWEEIYGDVGLVPIPAGNTAVQMGGWFNRKIDSVDDVKGLKMRIPGFGGDVIEMAGGSMVLKPGGDLYPSLERGLIDALEWIGPYHDIEMGFHKIAKYYYYPGWHEPGTVIELMVNKEAYESLPEDLREILRSAAARSGAWMTGEFEARNSESLEQVVKEGKVKLMPFPKEVLATFRKFTDAAIEEEMARDARSKKVYEHFNAFRKRMGAWAEYSEKAYYTRIIG